MNILGYVQKLGKALMLPIATLPVAALLMRLGAPDVFDIPIMAKSGGEIFNQIPLLFAIGIAIGLSVDGAGAAALAGSVAFFVLNTVTQTIESSINMGVFGGVFAGIIGGHCYNNFYKTRLPEFLAFFAGKRLVPIVSGVVALILGFVFGHVWPLMQLGLDHLTNGIASSGPFGQFSYGFLNRALIPVGLHHILNTYFWFTYGECLPITVKAVAILNDAKHLCVDPTLAKELVVGQPHTFLFNNSVTPEITAVVKSVAETTINGDIHRFFAGDKSAGQFMVGFYPIMMTGLPAAALAMYFAAKPENKKQAAGLLGSVAFCAFLTGVTEPLEFTFLFLAPGLYLIHAILTGLSLAATGVFGSLHGFGFSAGLIDFVLSWGVATKPEITVALCLASAIIYFVIFYIAITQLNLKTPGREDVDQSQEAKEAIDIPKDNLAHAQEYIEALGGSDNLAVVEACITRLRLTLRDRSKVDEHQLMKLGAKGVVKLGDNNLQVILGPLAEIIAGEINQLMPEK